MAKARSKGQTRKRPARRRGGKAPVRMVFERRNYLLMLAGIACLVVGFAIMRLENEVDGFISLYVAPIVLLAGYGIVAYAILWQPKAQNDPGREES